MPARVPRGAPGAASSTSAAARVLLCVGGAAGLAQTPPAAASTAAVDCPVGSATAAYYQHPASMDATLHLSALAALQLCGATSGAAAKIPVSAGVFQGPARVASTMRSWAATQVRRRATPPNACVCTRRPCPSHPRLQVVLAPPGTDSITSVRHISASQHAASTKLHGLVARDVQSSRQQGAPSSTLTQYQVEWQASAVVVAGDAPAPAPPARWRQPLLAALSSSGAHATVMQNLRLPSTGPSPTACLLQALQSSEHLRASAEWQVAADVQLGSNPVPGGQRPAGAAAAAAASALHAMLKVAVHEGVLPAATAITLRGEAPGSLARTCSEAAGSRQFGAVLQRGVVYRPVLCAVDSQAAPASASTQALRSVLVAGGLGGLGMLTASWLAQLEQAQRLVLLGRTGRPKATQLAHLLTASVPVTLVRCDIASRDETLAAAAGANHPLSAVMHAGGTLADAALPSQSAANLRAVAGAKLAGERWRRGRCCRTAIRCDP